MLWEEKHVSGKIVTTDDDAKPGVDELTYLEMYEMILQGNQGGIIKGSRERYGWHLWSKIYGEKQMGIVERHHVIDA